MIFRKLRQRSGLANYYRDVALSLDRFQEISIDAVRGRTVDELEEGLLHMPFGDPIRSDDSYFAVYPERKSHNANIILFRDWLIRQTRKHVS